MRNAIGPYDIGRNEKYQHRFAYAVGVSIWVVIGVPVLLVGAALLGLL